MKTAYFEYYENEFLTDQELLTSKLLENKVQDYLDRYKIIDFGNVNIETTPVGKHSCEYLFNFILLNAESCIELTEGEKSSLLEKVNDAAKLLKNKNLDCLNCLWRLFASDKYSSLENEQFNLLNNFLSIFELDIIYDWDSPFSIKEINDDLKKFCKSIETKELHSTNNFSYFGKVCTYLRVEIMLIYKFYFNQHEQLIGKLCEILSEELYCFLNGIIKNGYNPVLSYLDFNFVGEINDILNQCLHVDNFALLEPNKKSLVLKYFYIMSFFGNTVGATICNNPLYVCGNYIDGFNNNFVRLHKTLITNLESTRPNTKLNYDHLFSNTVNETDKLLETALYQFELVEYSPIFKGIEYTPILVDVFKSVEELCCDLFEKLHFEETSVKIKNKRFELISFDSKGLWRDDITLGNINIFIQSINQKEFRILYRQKDVDNKFRHIYDSSLIFSKSRIEKIAEINNKYGKQLGIEIPYNDMLPNSDNLFKIFDCWIQKCRNGCLHKHNTVNILKLNFAFDFTWLLLSLLFEWETILENNTKDIFSKN